MPANFMSAAFANTLFQLTRKGGLESALHALFLALEGSLPVEFLHVYRIGKKADGHFAFLICAFYDAQGHERPTIICEMEDTGVFGKLEEKYFTQPQICDDIQNDPATEAISRMLFPEFHSALNQHLFHVGDESFFFGALAREPHVFTAEHAAIFAAVQEPCTILCQNIALQQKEMLESRESSTLFGQRMLAKSPADMLRLCRSMPQVMDFAEEAAISMAPVLILGESGVGKEVLADAIQALSPRKNGPYIKINCGALTESLLDSELFGHERGAFTGALRENQGYFEQANGGTILLDEVGELSPQAQVRLLRVLDRKEVQRVGGGIRKGLDIRVIAATNQNVTKMLAEGSFRNDLYFRLNTLKVTIPPLRKRREDIPVLMRVLWEEKAHEWGMEKAPEIPEEEIVKLYLYPWPGNVRELSAVLDRGMLAYTRTQTVRFYVEEAPRVFRTYQEQPFAGGRAEMSKQAVAQIYAPSRPLPYAGTYTVPYPAPEVIPPSDFPDPAGHLDSIMSQHIKDALRRCGKVGGKGGAAEMLGLHPNTLRARMKKLGIPTKS